MATMSLFDVESKTDSDVFVEGNIEDFVQRITLMIAF